MNWQAISYDWNQVRAFLATAEEGSFSAAARATRSTQPTLSRQVSALEQDLGVTLFERGNRSVNLTAAGLELLEHVRAMGEAATRVSLAASGQSQTIDGEVCITTTTVFAMYHLPQILERIREQAPGIVVEIIPSNEVRDLRRREADISVRHAPPEHGELIGKKLGAIDWRLCASKSYLDRIGRPTQPSELADADFIGFEYREQLVEQYNQLGIPVTGENFKLICSSGAVILAMMKRGLGIGMTTQDVLDREPELELAMPSLPPLDVPVWLVTHRELRTSRKIRLVFDVIAEYVTEVQDEMRSA